MPSVFIFSKHLKWKSKYDDCTLQVANLCNKIKHITYHMQMLPVIQINRKESSPCFFFILYCSTSVHNIHNQEVLELTRIFLWKFGNAINTFFLRYKKNNKFILIIVIHACLLNPFLVKPDGGRGGVGNISYRWLSGILSKLRFSYFMIVMVWWFVLNPQQLFFIT